MLKNALPWVAVSLALAGFAAPSAAQEAEQSLDEVRNTIINLLEAMVQRGLLSQEQAQGLVADAQEKARAAATTRSQQEAAEEDAVRVTYVPQIVRDEIAQQLSEELRGTVVRDVIEQAKTERWGVPGALPEWLSRVRISGDVRVRAQGDVFADDNVANSYLNYQALNQAGGASAAGVDAFLNLTEDQVRERLRVRLGFDAQLASGMKAGVRLATGNLEDPVSPNQTLGRSGTRFQFAVEQAYLQYDAGSERVPWMTLRGGRMPNPWRSTDLVFDPDLQFDGAAGTWRVGFGSGATRPHVFMTLGGFPVQEVELSTDDKWLYAGQLGFEFPWGNGFRASLAGAYYHYDNIVGVRNLIPDSTLLDYTAPEWLQKGNTVFPIAVDSNNEVRLYGLAADYHLVNVTGALELPVFGNLISLTADYVSNIGYDQDDVLARSGFSSLEEVLLPEAKLAFDELTEGYSVEIGFGSRETGRRGHWRAALGYKYLERDAVLDAFTDSDFHLGGTGAKGYVFRTDWWFLDRTWLTLRYFSTDEIPHTGPVYQDSNGSQILPSDTPRFGVDTLMIDLNGQF